MGRIKTTLIKRVAKDLFKADKSTFKSDFNENKKILGKIADIESKKLRNAIAGYLVRLVTRDKKAS